jgi:hypothetical protein
VLGIITDPQFGFAVGARDMIGQWHRAKLAIGCGIDLNR